MSWSLASPLHLVSMSQPTLDCLSEISAIFEQICQQLTGIVASDCGPSIVANDSQTYPRLELDIPDSLRLASKLRKFGAPEALATDLSSIHTARSMELATHYSDIYEQSCKDICNNYPASLQRRSILCTRLQSIGELYDRTTRRWEKEYISLVKERIHPLSARPFNQVGAIHSCGSLANTPGIAFHALPQNLLWEKQVSITGRQTTSRPDVRNERGTNKQLGKHLLLSFSRLCWIEGVKFQNHRTRSTKSGDNDYERGQSIERTQRRIHKNRPLFDDTKRQTEANNNVTDTDTTDTEDQCREV